MESRRIQPLFTTNHRSARPRPRAFHISPSPPSLHSPLSTLHQLQLRSRPLALRSRLLSDSKVLSAPSEAALTAQPKQNLLRRPARGLSPFGIRICISRLLAKSWPFRSPSGLSAAASRFPVALHRATPGPPQLCIGLVVVRSLAFDVNLVSRARAHRLHPGPSASPSHRGVPRPASCSVSRSPSAQHVRPQRSPPPTATRQTQPASVGLP